MTNRWLTFLSLVAVAAAWLVPSVRAADKPSPASPNHWAWQPLRRPEVPRVGDDVRSLTSSQTPDPKSKTQSSQRLLTSSPTVGALDRFLLAKLAEKNLSFSQPADARTLIRRLYLTTIGLPPTPEEVEAFEREFQIGNRQSAIGNLVDRLLASPHFGERWARHWLDVVRFAESNGYETNGPRKNAWPYRDWVIRAFNSDMPYDRFIAEQLAGDTLGVDEATGFIVGGPTDIVKSPDPVLTANQRAEDLNDFAATTASAFLGLTLHCARCHNHKFDPIATTDYYAVVACFAGVQHGERAVKPANIAELQAKADALRRELVPIERKLAQFDPPAHPARTLLIHTDDAKRTAQLVPSQGEPAKYPEGLERGQAGDTGNASRLPTLGKGYLYWNQVPGRNVFAWSPQVAGRFRIWLSWGGGYATHAEDARYFLDTDGDAATTADQTEIAQVSHQKFADGSGSVPGQRQWSGFFNAGAHELLPTSKVFLRGGTNSQYVSADVVMFQEEPPAALTQHAARSTQPSVRLAVTRGLNTERFAPVAAKFLRFTVAETTQLEPCIDELEAFTAEAAPRNVALASAGARATASGTYPNNPFHKLEHVNDGQYGNERSWISHERGKGWVQIEFAREETIDRVAWSRDRDNVPRYNDRLATRYRVEVSRDGAAWQTVASADDRLAFGAKVPGGVIYATGGAAGAEAGQLVALLASRKKLEAEITATTTFPMVYAGRFSKPADTHLMHRGDPMQPREKVAPGALASFAPKLSLPAEATDSERRLALAKWLGSPQHPLTARVIVNRLWHYHFGTGLVDTPSDFGLNGGRPSHPELLDWLASELVASGWRLKHVHGLILTSAAFQQSGVAADVRRLHSPQTRDASTKPLSNQSLLTSAATVDASNRLLWHFPARRLEAEPLRDAMLAVSGKLDRTMGGPGFDLFAPNSNYVKVYNSRTDFGPAEFRRMVYQSKPRTELDNTFGAFDCPDAGQVTPKRTSSTTPLQALNLLNSPFAVQQAGFFAERVESEAGKSPEAQVKRAFQLAFLREPVAEELAASVKLVQAHGLLALCRALFNANEFLTVF